MSNRRRSTSPIQANRRQLFFCYNIGAALSKHDVVGTFLFKCTMLPFLPGKTEHPLKDAGSQAYLDSSKQFGPDT